VNFAAFVVDNCFNRSPVRRSPDAHRFTSPVTFSANLLVRDFHARLFLRSS